MLHYYIKSIHLTAHISGPNSELLVCPIILEIASFPELFAQQMSGHLWIYITRYDLVI